MDPNNKLLDDFFEMQLFHCIHCKNLLQTPVMLVEKLGNVCYNCYDKIKSEGNVVALENTTISTMLEKMKVPCENRSQGCIKIIQYKQMQQHKDQCIYQNFHCRAPDKCSWIGCLKDFVNHYRETHTECHFEYQNDTFTLDTSKENLKEGVHLLNTSYGDFFLDVNKTEQDIRFFVFPMTKNIDDLKYTFSVALVGEKDRGCFSACQILDWKSFITATYDEYDDTTKINLDCLKYMLKDGKFGLIKITLTVADELDTVGSAVLRNLECQKCKLYPKSAVYSCKSGHIFCATCKDIGNLCGHTVSKNEVLNKIIENIRLPCKFMNKGCRVKMPMNSKHDSLCHFKEWPCLIPSCNFSGSYTALINHNIQQHTSNCLIDTSHIEIHSTLATQDYYLIHDNQLFYLSYKYTSTSVNNGYGGYSYKYFVTWAMNIIGYTEQFYSYEIEINFKQLCMKFRAPCSYKGDEMPQSTSNKNLFAFGAANVIKLPDDMFEQVSGKYPDLKYTVNIFKD